MRADLDAFEGRIKGAESLPVPLVGLLRQIPANTVEKVAVPGVQAGTNVTFKAVTVDASRTYQSRNAPLSGTFVWSVP